MKLFFLLLILPLFLWGCHSTAHSVPAAEKVHVQETVPKITTPALPPAEPQPEETAPRTGQLKGPAEDLADAQRIADLYGITLVDFDGFDLALFYTEEDPETVIARGQENGWPPLSSNYTLSPF